MNLYLKIFLFIFAMIAAVGEVKSSTVVNISRDLRATTTVLTSMIGGGILSNYMHAYSAVKGYRYANVAAKEGMKAITQFSGKTIDDAVSLVMKDANKLNHLFPAKHNLGGLVNQLGGQENTIRAILNAANGKLPMSGVFNNIPVNIGRQTIFIRGSVINGLPRLGTMYIP